MKSSHWFTMASAIAGCAVALGFYLTWDGGPENRSQGVEKAKRPTARNGREGMLRPAPGSDDPGGIRASRVRPGTTPSREIPTAAALRVTGRPVPGAQAVVSEAEWFARAAKVEQEATREVRRLAEMLDLNADQQAGIFGVVARNSSSWLPGMQVGGAPLGRKVDGTVAEPGMSEADQVMAYLDADQQRTLIQEEMDRQAWWEEVLPQLLPPDFPAGAEPVSGPAAGDPVPDTKPFDGAETLTE